MKCGRCSTKGLSVYGICICQRVRRLSIMELLTYTRFCLQMESIMLYRLLDDIK